MDMDTIHTPGVTFLKETATRKTGPGRESGLPEPADTKSCKPVRNMIILPDVTAKTFHQADIKRVFEKRETLRTYKDTRLSLPELSLLLTYTQGVRKITGKTEFRFVPSAGATHAIETYLLINRVSGLEKGIYRYLPMDHAIVLEDCTEGEPDDVARCIKKPDMILQSAVTFIWVACPERILWLFGSRGWRYLFLDAGHICQNLYLAAEAIDCGVCAVGSFFDEEAKAVIGIKEKDDFVIYMATVGKR